MDSERPCDLVKGCYSPEENGELMRGSGEGGEQGWVGGGDGVGRAPSFLCHPPELGTTSGVVNWASEGVQLLRRSAGTSNALVTRTAQPLIGPRSWRGGVGGEV